MYMYKKDIKPRDSVQYIALIEYRDDVLLIYNGNQNIALMDFTFGSISLESCTMSFSSTW